MRSLFVIFCCFIAPVTYGQTLWSLQSLRQVAQSGGSIHSALGPSRDVYIAGLPGAFPWPKPTNSIGDISSAELLISKLDASGNPLYATAIGGAGSGSLTLDAAGNLYVYGTANASAFATTPGAFNGSAYVTSGDYVCKLRAADGSILFCSFPGTGGYESGGLTADPMGNVYFAESPSPTKYPSPTQGALALGTQFVQVTKLDPVGAIIYRAQFSGPLGTADPTSIAADAQGDVWVAGIASADFPTTPNALLPTAQMPAGFLAELNSSGSALLYSTFTDGSGGAAQIALDSAGNIYYTDRTAAGAGILRKYAAGGAAIAYRHSFPSLTSLRLPFFVDAAGEVTALGSTTSVNFPTYNPVEACARPAAFGDWILIRVDAAGELIESTFLSIPVPYPSLPQIASNGYFLMMSTPTANEAYGPYQLNLGQLGPTSDQPINLACVGNAASLELAALAPGEIGSLFGNGLGPASPVSAQFANNRLPFNLAGTQVTFNGVPAPLLYASDSQINAIVPWEIQSSRDPLGASTANVCVVYQSNATNCITMNVANAAPGIFQLPSGYAAVVNQDGTINAPQNPAAIGSIVSLYVTGLGPLSPTPADGSILGLPLPTLANGVKVLFHPYARIGVASGQVLYAGSAPLEVAGLFQVNVVIPVLPISGTPMPPARVEIEMDLPDGSSVTTSQGLPISIRGINAENGAPP